MLFETLETLSRAVRAPLGMIAKTARYFIDSTLRDKVVPVPGSVLYCDLWLAIEHSGIHVGDGTISNIEVDGIAESTVALSDARGFTSKSTLGRHIYVSCDGDGPVGDTGVAGKAASHVGERAFYGLVYKNCHQFSTGCVNHAARPDAGFSLGALLHGLADHDWEPSLAALKTAARTRLGATKWRLWDWTAEDGEGPEPAAAPDWDAIAQQLHHTRLDAASIDAIRAELAQVRAYQAEIADETIPQAVRQRLSGLADTLSAICHRYDEMKDFLESCPGAGFSYADLQACDDDLAALARIMRANVHIRELARKLGRNHIAEEKKRQARIPRASRSEIHGTCRSDDLMRMLPSELLNLEDDTLEALFYARLLEKNLLSYELRGTEFSDGERIEASARRTGPVVACLDTSGSMHGAPLQKAKALLLAIAAILESEGRALHVLLFGAGGELRELALDGAQGMPGLLRFLATGFGGGTDFETPLRRAFDIIAAHAIYAKADVLMISDGDCQLSPAFVDTMRARKQSLDCSVYSVLCAGTRVDDAFSDSVVTL